MTLPTPHAELYRWHTRALEDVDLHFVPEAHPDEVQCGWFKRKLVKGGPFVPARIWMFQPVEDGQLVGDETFQCEVNGSFADAEDQWQWLCRSPITEAEFDYLTAALAWAADNAPDEPMANPREAVDWGRVPTPTFSAKETNHE